MTPDGWKAGRLCDVSQPPYSAVTGMNATAVLQQAIEDCGDLVSGGTVLVPAGLDLMTASLWMRSNLTLRVEKGASLVGTTVKNDAPMVYTRRECTMRTAHAGLLNAGRCLRLKDPLVGWDDCAEWSKLVNVAIEGGGLLDANGDHWYQNMTPEENGLRPMMLDLLWVDGLTIRDMQIRRPGFWTVHPTFSNNVRVTGNDILTYGVNTDGCDPDSSWNVYIAQNSFSTGDDCIAIKSGRDWSGIMVNISTTNVLAEQNVFAKGHGVSIGSETSGWVRNITIRDSVLHGTNLAVRIKSMRGRGGGVEDVLYQNLTGSVISGLQLTLNYHAADPTNVTATPEIHNIIIRDINVTASNKALECIGLDDSLIDQVVLDNVQISGNQGQTCTACSFSSVTKTQPEPSCGLPLERQLGAEFPLRSWLASGTA